MSDGVAKRIVEFARQAIRCFEANSAYRISGERMMIVLDRHGRPTAEFPVDEGDRRFLVTIVEIVKADTLASGDDA